MKDKNRKNNTGGNVLHGNSARVDPQKTIAPQFQNVVNDYKDSRYGRSFHRFDGIDNNVVLAKKEVDSNPL